MASVVDAAVAAEMEAEEAVAAALVMVVAEVG